MKSLILTGFGPFGRYSTNLSGEIVKRLKIEDESYSVVRSIIPVSWKRSIRSFKNTLNKLPSKPSLIILLGIHLIKMFHLEKMAWNFKFGIDNDKKFKFSNIRFNLYPWLKTSLNLKKIYLEIEENSHISISYFAGYYLCNYLYYWALHLSKKNYPVLFIHVPSKGNLSEHINMVKMILQAIIKIYENEKL